jgi:hypothetical protein
MVFHVKGGLGCQLSLQPILRHVADMIGRFPAESRLHMGEISGMFKKRMERGVSETQNGSGLDMFGRKRQCLVRML